MLHWCLAVYQDVIKVHQHIPFQIGRKDPVYHSLERAGRMTVTPQGAEKVGRALIAEQTAKKCGGLARGEVKVLAAVYLQGSGVSALPAARVSAA